MKLIEQLQQQAQQQEKPKGVEFDQLQKMWQEAGAPKTPEKVFQLLTKALGGNESVAKDAFKEIGIAFEQRAEGPAEVLDPNVAKQLKKFAQTLSPDRLRQIIKAVEGAGKPKKRAQQTQQQGVNRPQTPQQIQQNPRAQATQASKTSAHTAPQQGQANPQGMAPQPAS